MFYYPGDVFSLGNPPREESSASHIHVDDAGPVGAGSQSGGGNYWGLRGASEISKGDGMGRGGFGDWITGEGVEAKGNNIGVAEMLARIDVSGNETEDVVRKRVFGKRERCFIVGNNDKAEIMWQMNSRALCVVEDMCLSGQKMDQVRTMGWIEGGLECGIVKAGNGRLKVRDHASVNSENRCRDIVRERLVMKAYGEEIVEDNQRWLQRLSRKRYNGLGAGRMKAVEFKSNFAIIVPKYQWTHNICHYSRVWNYIAHVIRNLKAYGVTEEDHEGTIDVLYRSGIAYDKTWMVGLKEALIDQLQEETGLNINVGRLRHDRFREAQCVHKAIMLGSEGRVDSLPFLNDTSVWSRQHNLLDEHWPTIPRQSLLLREAMYKKLNLGRLSFFGEGDGRFGLNGEVARIKVPPLTVAYVVRSTRSKRRFGIMTKAWFGKLVYSLATEMGFEVQEVSFNKQMPMKEQVGQLRNAGVVTGIHGANFVNTMFMPPGGALVEMFPYRYARAYYMNGGNAGLRYSFHVTRSGKDQGCSWSPNCFLKYRESRMDFDSTDKRQTEAVLRKAMLYIKLLHKRFPEGTIELERIEDEDACRIPLPT